MPFTTLNKIIAQFLVGGAALLMLGFIHWQQVRVLLGSPGDAHLAPSGGFWAAVGLGFLALAGLLGGAVEGLSDGTLRGLLSTSKNTEWLPRVLARRLAYRNLSRWRQRLRSKLRASDGFRWIVEEDNESGEWYLYSASAGLFLSSADRDEFRWLTEEYATFVLMTNLAFILPAGFVYSLVAKVFAHYELWWSVGLPFEGRGLGMLLCSAVVFWALCSLAVGKYLYAHEMAARHWCLKLDQSREGGALGGAVLNRATTPGG